jgi:abortive infection alpha-like protein
MDKTLGRIALMEQNNGLDKDVRKEYPRTCRRNRCWYACIAAVRNPVDGLWLGLCRLHNHCSAFAPKEDTQMMDDHTEEVTPLTDGGIDITGVGKAMNAIPPAAWQRMVDTACTTIEKTLAPITEIAHGIGRLIKAKFDSLVDAQQVMAAESIASAKGKAEQSGRDVKMPRPQILMQVIEHSANETDGGIRELWSNLLAQEMVTQGVHPEVARVLSRLSSEDAQLLVTIAEQKPTPFSKLFAEAVQVALRTMPFAIPVTLNSEPATFNHAHLGNLGLIDQYNDRWGLTVFGEGFIQAVTDPSLAARPTNEAQ